jgi:hypothetical protein
MKASASKIDWPRVVQQMAAGKACLEAAIHGDEQAREEATFARLPSMEDRLNQR